MATTESVPILATGVAALLFAAVFVFSGRIQLGRWLRFDRRSIVSYSAGTSIAYVFVRLMPELHGTRVAVMETSKYLPLEGMAIYLLALVGFMCFYGLEHLRKQLSESAESEQDERSFWVHIGGFAAYAGLMSYLLVRDLEPSESGTALYAVAFGLHFLAVGHSLQQEHGAAYERTGRWLLAAACLLGWGLGVAIELPRFVVALLVAFISGAVIVNAAVMELPSEKDGRFWPFLLGGLLYAAVLLPLS
jgi:hypothetical protein